MESEIEHDNITSQSKSKQLDDYLSTQRNEWSKKIRNIADDLKGGENLPEISSFSLSYRQILVDMLASIGSKIRSQKSKVDREYKTRWIFYYSYDYKLSDGQRVKFIEADLSEDYQILELLENQKDFFSGSIKTLDNIGFAIKNRIDMKQL
jgi:hypothetical protein